MHTEPDKPNENDGGMFARTLLAAGLIIALLAMWLGATLP